MFDSGAGAYCTFLIKASAPAPLQYYLSANRCTGVYAICWPHVGALWLEYLSGGTVKFSVLVVLIGIPSSSSSGSSLASGV